MNIYVLNKKVPNTTKEEGIPGQNNKGWGFEGHRLKIKGGFVQVPNGCSYLRVVVRDRKTSEVFIDEGFEAMGDELLEAVMAGDITLPIGLDVVPFEVEELGIDVYVRGGNETGIVPDVKYSTVRIAFDMASGRK